MTDKELSKLKRRELLELMFEMRKKLDELSEENEKLRAKLVSFDKLDDSDVLRLAARRIERLYMDRFGEDDNSEDENDS